MGDRWNAAQQNGFQGKGRTHKLHAHVGIEVLDALLLVRLIRALHHILREHRHIRRGQSRANFVLRFQRGHATQRDRH